MEISQEAANKYICRHCKEETDDFYPSRIKKKIYSCKKCDAKQGKILRETIKRKCVEYKGGKCFVCGYNKFQGSLDFHHVDPKEKDFGIATMKSNSFESLKQELDKCVLLCKNCHCEVHASLIDLNKIGGTAGDRTQS
jgi:5-methylcytosine-specific restriction endonuclease McrA